MSSLTHPCPSHSITTLLPDFEPFVMLLRETLNLTYEKGETRTGKRHFSLRLSTTLRTEKLIIIIIIHYCKKFKFEKCPVSRIVSDLGEQGLRKESARSPAI